MPTKIHTREGNVLNVSSGFIVHGCNTLGVMDAGIAREIKYVYPAAFYVYWATYASQGLTLGNIIPTQVAPCLYVVNAVTQQSVGTYKRQVDYDAVPSCFRAVSNLAIIAGLFEVHFPLIGCGLAGGDWSEVSQRIEAALDARIAATLWILPNTRRRNAISI